LTCASVDDFISHLEKYAIFSIRLEDVYKLGLNNKK